MTGQKFTRLIVMYRTKNHIRPNGQSIVRWHCKCECGKEKDVDGAELRKGNVNSCGCLQVELTIERESETNTYDLSGEYGVGYTIYNEKFYFDLEDYDLLKDSYFRIRDDGYVSSNKVGLLHRLIRECPKDKVIDHINKIKYDNRKENLQICNQSENTSKKSIMKSNTSGVIGVSWSKDKNKWLTRLNKNKKCIYLKYYNDKEDAIKSRLLAEKKYFGEFAPQKHLYEQYDIEI